MAQPRLVFAAAKGQSSVQVVFDQAMRTLGPTAPQDPQNPANWTPGGGLPAITSVLRLSDVEYELVLATPAPLAGGYTVTVATTVESAAGEKMDPAFRTQTFAVTVADFRFVSAVWFSATELDLTFSASLATIMFDAFSDVLIVEPKDMGARYSAVIGLSQSGATMRVTFDHPGTAGARYLIHLNREVFQSLATAVTLKAGDEEQSTFGQGAAPTITTLTATASKLEVTGSEVLGTEGWPLAPGAYSIDQGSLGSVVVRGTSPSILDFTAANLPVGQTVTFETARITRSAAVGVSLVNQASSALGAGTETVGVGVTTLNKIVGSPFEIVFSGGTDTFARTGRRFSTTIQATFTPSSLSYPLLAVTLLSTQVSVVITKTANNLAIAQVYRGQNPVTQASAPFDPTTAFTLTLIDGTGDTNGWFAVEVNGTVVTGAPNKDVFDTLLVNNSTGVTSFALTLGSPSFPAQTFSIAFSATIVDEAFLTTGLVGIDSRDLLSFPGSIASALVAAAPSPPSPGFANTGKAAFGVSAEYKEGVDAIQVIIALNDAVPSAFTGSVSLLTGNQQVLDQVPFDQGYASLTDDAPPVPELIVVFLHPKQWLGVLVGVTLTIGGVDYSSIVAVTLVDQPSVIAQLTQQPASWAHARLPAQVDLGNTESFGPATIILTP